MDVMRFKKYCTTSILRPRTSPLLILLFSALWLTIGVPSAFAASTGRVANVFDTSEEIVVTGITATGNVNYSIANAFGETYSGTEPVVNGTMRIPAYFMTSAPGTLTINGEVFQSALVPGVIRYSDHLVSPVSQHLCPVVTADPAGHARLFLQLGFVGTNFGDTEYETTDTNWLTFQKAMDAEGLYAFGKEGWGTPWPLTAAKIQNWTQWLLDNGVNNLMVTTGNEFEEGGFWQYGFQAYYDYTNLAYQNIKARNPEALVGGPDGVIIRDAQYNGLLTQAGDSLDYFSFHQTAMGVDSGATEGDVHTWVAKLKQNNVSKPMADGEMMSGSQGGLRESWGNTWSTYWHAQGIFINAGLSYNWPSSESSLLGTYMRGVVRLDFFNPCYENQPLWNFENGPGVNPIKNLNSRATAVRTMSDWLSGSFPLGRIDVADNHPNFNYLPRTEIWATKRGNDVGLWLWTNENLNANYTKRVEITTNSPTLTVVDDQGNVRQAQVENGVFRIRASGIPVFVTGFSDIPLVRAVDFANQTPQITSTPATEAVVGAKYLTQVDGFDAEDNYSFYNRNIASFSLTQSPSGMRIGSVSGRIEWTPATAGSFPVTIRYRDPQGLEDTLSFTITVKAAGQNVSPYFVSNPVRVAPISKQYFYTPKAIDPNGDTLTYSLTQSPAGSQINPTDGRITWTPTQSQDVTFGIQASDGRGGSTVQTFHVASGIIAIRTRGGWPTAPTNLGATTATNGSIVLNWQHTTDNSKGNRDEKGFVIERSSVTPPANINNQFGTARYNYNAPFEMVHVTNADVMSWTDFPPQSGTYYYRVKAVNHIADWGGYSNIVNTTTSGASPAPSSNPVPGDINNDSQVNGQDLRLILLSWLGVGSCSSFNCDLVPDGKLNVLDAAFVVKNFGL